MFTLTKVNRDYYHGDWKGNLPADFFSEDGDSDTSDLDMGHLIDYVNAFNNGPTKSSTDYNVILEREVEVFRTTWSYVLLKNSLLSSELKKETTVSTVHWHTGNLTEGFDLSEDIVDQLTTDREKVLDYTCMIALAFDEALFDGGRCLTSKLFADTDGGLTITDAEIRARDFTPITPTWPKHQVAKFNGHKKEADSLAHWDQRRIWAFSLAASAIADVMAGHLEKKEKAAKKKAEEAEHEAELKRLLIEKKTKEMSEMKAKMDAALKEIKELQTGLNGQEQQPIAWIVPTTDITPGAEILTLEEALQPVAGTQTAEGVTGETFEEAKKRLEEETEFNQGMVVKHEETERVGTFLEFSYPCQNKCSVCWKVFNQNTGDLLRKIDDSVDIQAIEASNTREFAVKKTDETWLVGKEEMYKAWITADVLAMLAPYACQGIELEGPEFLNYRSQGNPNGPQPPTAYSLYCEDRCRRSIMKSERDATVVVLARIMADKYLQLKGREAGILEAKLAEKIAIHEAKLATATAAGMTAHGETLHPDAPPNDDQTDATAAGTQTADDQTAEADDQKAETASAAAKPNPNLVEPKAGDQTPATNEKTGEKPVKTPYPVTLTSGSEDEEDSKDEEDSNDPPPPPNSKQAAIMANRAAATTRPQRKRKATVRFADQVQVGSGYKHRSDVGGSPTKSSKRARKPSPGTVHAVDLSTGLI